MIPTAEGIQLAGAEPVQSTSSTAREKGVRKKTLAG